ncbi:MAG: type 4a pilus biogenesis protein PilO [Patescibacteria group bacterium]
MSNKKFIISIILVVFLDLLALFAVFYFYLRIENQIIILNKIPQDLFLAENKEQNIKILKREIEEIKEQWKEVNSIFLDKESTVSFIENLESTGKKLGLEVKFDSIDFADKKTEKPILNLHAEGSFSNVFQFIVLLGNLPNSIVLKELRLSKISELWRGDFKILLTTYIIK